MEKSNNFLLPPLRWLDDHENKPVGINKVATYYTHKNELIFCMEFSHHVTWKFATAGDCIAYRDMLEQKLGFEI